MPWESIVMMHLTTKEELLVCPQYNIRWDKQTETNVPRFYCDTSQQATARLCS